MQGESTKEKAQAGQRDTKTAGWLGQFRQIMSLIQPDSQKSLCPWLLFCVGRSTGTFSYDRWDNWSQASPLFFSDIFSFIKRYLFSEFQVLPPYQWLSYLSPTSTLWKLPSLIFVCWIFQHIATYPKWHHRSKVNASSLSSTWMSSSVFLFLHMAAFIFQFWGVKSGGCWWIVYILLTSNLPIPHCK